MKHIPLRSVKDFTKQTYYCIDCGIELKTKSNRCVKCAHLHQRRVERPNREELKKLIRSMSFVKIGQKFGVSDNSIRKWCKAENLPYKSSEIKKYTDDEWKIL